jgi:hypothetical protein
MKIISVLILVFFKELVRLQRGHFDDFDLVGTLCGADNNNN